MSLHVLIRTGVLYNMRFDVTALCSNRNDLVLLALIVGQSCDFDGPREDSHPILISPGKGFRPIHPPSRLVSERTVTWVPPVGPTHKRRRVCSIIYYHEFSFFIFLFFFFWVISSLCHLLPIIRITSMICLRPINMILIDL